MGATEAALLTFVFLFLIYFPASAFAADYYVDFDGGSDSNDGLFPATAWKRAPGDANATGNARSKTLVPGDIVRFKGGVIYYGAIDMPVSGNANSKIKYDGDGWPGLEGTKAIIDGTESITGWQRCQSLQECGNNPEWQNIHHTVLPAGIDLAAPNLMQNGELLFIAQEPDQPDPFFEDDVDYFKELPAGYMTTTSIRDPEVFNQADPEYWAGSQLLLWTIPNVVTVSTINSYSPSQNTVYFNATNDPAGYDRYAVYNSIHALDTQGEYFISKQNRKVFVYSTSPPANIRASSRTCGINTHGRSHIFMEGFEVRGFSGSTLRKGTGIGNCDSSGAASSGIVIRNNLVTKNNQEASGYGGINLYMSSDSVIENNTVIMNPKHMGIFVQCTESRHCTNNSVRNNNIIKNGHFGIGFYSVDNSEIINNTIINNTGTHANAITVYLYSTNVTVSHNRVYNSNFAFAYNNLRNLTLSYNILENFIDRRSVGNGADVQNAYIHHNTMIGRIDALNNDAYGFVVQDNILDSFCYDEARAIVDHNLYINPIWCQNPLKESDAEETDMDKIFTDPARRDYAILFGTLVGAPPFQKDPCTMSTSGSYVGALECAGCAGSIPAASFFMDKNSGSEPLTVAFDASSSQSCGGNIESYQWDFGDGDSGSGMKVNHTFSDGTYNIMLTARNSLGYSGQTTRSVLVRPASEAGIVMHLPLDGNALDVSGTGNDGSWSGTGIYGSGIRGSAAIFDGTANGSYITINDDQSLGGMQELTVAAWAKKADRKVGNALLAKHVAYYLSLGEDSVSFYIFNENSTWLPTRTLRDQKINSTEWHHYAFTYNGSKFIFYLDGTKLNEQNYGGRIIDNSNSLMIGRGVGSGPAFAGMVDEVKIYQKALSPAEVSALASILFHRADTNQNGCTEISELLSFISRWKLDNQDVSLREIIEAIGLWKGGCA